MAFILYEYSGKRCLNHEDKDRRREGGLQIGQFSTALSLNCKFSVLCSINHRSSLLFQVEIKLTPDPFIQSFVLY